MKKYSGIITIIIFILIAFYLFILPKIKSSNYSLNAIVISISPASKRSGKSVIQLKQESTSRYIYYTFLYNVPDITVGDSLIKSPNSKILFVKSKKDGALTEARDQHYLLRP